ncbi:MAG: GIY-YIG nuclease family protein [Actinobacteria bacterium]|nr:GIY-YIG nuclease family protein [Actinomycetota bacterium]
MNDKAKRLKQDYKQRYRPMGVYQIRNIVNNKILLGASLNLAGILNRHKFELKMGNHRNKTLQAEWCEMGSENFVFVILDELELKEAPDYDYKEDLLFLEHYWLDKLKPFGDRGYNEKKKI